ncbi:hypothetical protein TMRO357_02006 [Alteriqipengyuania sp. 357]
MEMAVGYKWRVLRSFTECSSVRIVTKLLGFVLLIDSGGRRQAGYLGQWPA